MNISNINLELKTYLNLASVHESIFMYEHNSTRDMHACMTIIILNKSTAEIITRF